MDNKTKDRKVLLFEATMPGLPVDVALTTGWKKITEKILINLKPEEAELLRLRFGMAGCREHTLEELSTQWDLSSEKLCQIEVKALRHLCELNLNIQQDFAGIKNEDKGVWSEITTGHKKFRKFQRDDAAFPIKPFHKSSEVISITINCKGN